MDTAAAHPGRPHLRETLSVRARGDLRRPRPTGAHWWSGLL